MQIKALTLIALLIIGTSAFAGILPWGLTSTMLIRWEDEQLDTDPSVGKARLTLQKPLQIVNIDLTTQVYCEYDAYEGFLSNDRKETDTGILFDFVAIKNDSVNLTVSSGYEYQDNIGENKDGLMILQLKAEI